MVSRVQTPGGLDTGLQPGDVVHGVNGTLVFDIDALKSALRKLQPGDPVALFIERAGPVTVSCV
jgi:S1-C subfamily serine protease